MNQRCRWWFDLKDSARRGIRDLEKRSVLVLNALAKIFTWWNGATLGTLYDIGRRASFVGEDEQGNKFYEENKVSIEGRKRRYVTYNGYAEPSRVSPDWHGWLHHTFEHPPTVEPFQLQAWEKPHQANMTGTLLAYRPKGSLASGGARAKASGDYEAWGPE
jgi:NADH:ubiquinone oxidoreductase subunit